MKKLHEMEFKLWFLMKQSNAALINASNYTDWEYEVIKETEKAIQIKLDRPNRSSLKADWHQWIPKSAIENLSEVLN